MWVAGDKFFALRRLFVRRSEEDAKTFDGRSQVAPLPNPHEGWFGFDAEDTVDRREQGLDGWDALCCVLHLAAILVESGEWDALLCTAPLV